MEVQDVVIYADVIVDISHENLDKSYQYAVPEHLQNEIEIGSYVEIPFGRGNKIRTGYVVGLSTEPKCAMEYIKPIKDLVKQGIAIESHLIHLAYWIKEQYGATMNDALRTVIPVKKTVKSKERRFVFLAKSEKEIQILVETYEKKHYTARVRLLTQLLKQDGMAMDVLMEQFKIGRSTISDLEKLNIIRISSEIIYRNPVKATEEKSYDIKLSKEQQQITSQILSDYREGIRKTYLIHGVTGSGKTEVYMEIIDGVIQEGKQVIMLIPEIALTYQTVQRFYQRFGDRISILNSRMSQGERYDQYVRAKNGEIDIMIGPRSALFTPFQRLGLIIMDEEHEGSYKSEMPPKYHAREVAIERAKQLSASVLLGSATPSLESYKRALTGEYQLFELKERISKRAMPTIYVEDLREELKAKNRSIFSRKLKELMEDRLKKGQQIMLFINRRGYAGFVSCRSCGYVMKCPHCDVSLTSHTNGKLVCHYCGYETEKPSLCPSCKSKYIAAFGTGTQKVEEYVHKEFPTARVLRMDADTTSGKEGHEKILSAFSSGAADILIGTQMIVKGHDFSNVTLVGIIAADLSLYANDYRASERTFQLLSQAAGRAGRGEEPGEVVIQTYNPEQYSVVAASHHDYKEFYNHEIAYRTAMMYPPVSHIFLFLITSKQEETAKRAATLLAEAVKKQFQPLLLTNQIKLIGPAKANVSKINDIYRYVLHVKGDRFEQLKQIKDYLEGFAEYSELLKGCKLTVDVDPMSSL